MITLKSVSRIFAGRTGTVQALADVDLDIEDNEFVAVIGRSGCGKSTLLRLIAGLLPPTDGAVMVDGEEVHGPRRDVSVVFQRPALLPWRSVLANVLLPIEIARQPVARYRDEAMALLAEVGLAGFERRKPHELSGGMQQRVSLCRSLLQRPGVLLADEPFSALDSLTREELALMFQRIQAQRPSTVVFVTHSIDEAVMLADRVVVLSARPGRIRQIVRVDLPRPRSLGQDEHVEETARLRAHLHELLLPHGA